jgi:hydrogenase maturation protease
MTCPDKPVELLILGLGNVLCSDDGVGAIAVARLAREFDAPSGVQILDGGTLGLSLLPYLQDARTVILVDAIRADASPGSLVRLEGSEVAPAVRERLSPHQVGVADLLDGARWLDQYPESVVLLGIVPESLELGVTLSPSVEAQVPKLVSWIVEEAQKLGRPLTRTANYERVDPLHRLDADRLVSL